MHSTTLIDAAGSVIRTDGPTRTQIDQNNCRESENLETYLLVVGSYCSQSFSSCNPPSCTPSGLPV